MAARLARPQNVFVSLLLKTVTKIAACLSLAAALSAIPFMAAHASAPPLPAVSSVPPPAARPNPPFRAADFNAMDASHRVRLCLGRNGKIPELPAKYVIPARRRKLQRSQPGPRNSNAKIQSNSVAWITNCGSTESISAFGEVDKTAIDVITTWDGKTQMGIGFPPYNGDTIPSGGVSKIEQDNFWDCSYNELIGLRLNKLARRGTPHYPVSEWIQNQKRAGVSCDVPSIKSDADLLSISVETRDDERRIVSLDPSRGFMIARTEWQPQFRLHAERFTIQ